MNRRAPWHDYSGDGAYFITICTAGREYLFGKIDAAVMCLSDAGRIVEQEWERSFEIRSELSCDAFAIMPNHIHAIVRICSPRSHARPCVATGGTCVPTGKTGIAYRPPKSVSSFVAGFKSSATKRINEFRCTPKQPVWQPRFYDHIIRDAGEYERIEKYIADNPLQWELDEWNKEDQMRGHQ